MFASGPAIATRFRQLADERGLTLDKISLSLKEIAQWVDQPDARGKLARQAIDEGASALGRGLSLAANLLDPERMILGGGVASLGLSWLDAVRRAMRQRTLVPFEDSFVELAGLGDKAALVGGAVLAQQLLPG